MFTDTRKQVQPGCQPHLPLGPRGQHHAAPRMCLGLQLLLSPWDLTPLQPPDQRSPHLSSAPGHPPGDAHPTTPDSRLWGSSLLPWSLFSAQPLPVSQELGGQRGPGPLLYRGSSTFSLHSRRTAHLQTA